MSVEFAVSHIQWSGLEEALTDGYIARPFWKNQFAIQDSTSSHNRDNEIASALTATESYIQLRPHLSIDQRVALDEIVGGLMWNYDYPVPSYPTFNARTNLCDVDALRDAAQSLLAPSSVTRMLAVYGEVDFDALRDVAQCTLTQDMLDTFESPDAFVDYVRQWRDSLQRAASSGYGFFTYIASTQY